MRLEQVQIKSLISFLPINILVSDSSNPSIFIYNKSILWQGVFVISS
jgi:hypothetical protein